MKTLTFRVTDDEERLIRTKARMAGVSVSEFLRQQVRAEGKVSVIKSRATGAPAFASTMSAAPLTTNAVRQMLADFP